MPQTPRHGRSRYARETFPRPESGVNSEALALMKPVSGVSVEYNPC